MDIHRDDHAETHGMMDTHDDNERNRIFGFAVLAAKCQLPGAGCEVLKLPARLTKCPMASHGPNHRPSIAHGRGNAQGAAHTMLNQDSDEDTCKSEDFVLALEVDEKAVLEGAPVDLDPTILPRLSADLRSRRGASELLQRE